METVTGQIKGQLVKFDANTVVLRAGGAEWTFAREGKTTVTGTPACPGCSSR